MASSQDLNQSPALSGRGGEAGSNRQELFQRHREKLLLFAGIWAFWAVSVWKTYQSPHPEAERLWAWLNAGWLVLVGLYALWTLWRVRQGRVPPGRLQGSMLALLGGQTLTLFSITLMIATYGWRS